MVSLGIDLAIVTGAGRGIGRACALAIADRGVHVLCISRTGTCEKTAEEITRTGGTASALPIDLAEYDAARRSVAGWLEAYPANRIAVVAAAGILGPRGPIWDTDLAGWDRAFRVNLLGNIAVIQAALPTIRTASFGRIVMFAGGGSAYAYPVFPGYAVSKTAAVREIENIGAELSDLNDFSAVILAPGAVDTDMLADVRDSGAEVRTVTMMTEPVAFVTSFINARNARRLSGRFIHVRDTWQALLEENSIDLADNVWRLRRVE